MKFKLRPLRKIKRNFELICGTILLMILFSCTKKNPIDCISYSFPDAYKYPIKPGTQEWIDLGSRDARANACMITEEILQKISTGGLFESLLSYPFILDYGAWEELQVGFEKLKSENKGFTELYSREDLFHIIYEWYESMSLDCKEWIYHPSHAPIEVELEIIEMFIFQNEFLDNLNQDQIIEIYKLIFNKLQSKVEHGYPDGGKWISAAILGKIMYREEFKQFIDECNNNEFILFFIESIPLYRPVEIDPIEIIAKYTEEFYLFPYRY
jgi:hypothetical protein